MSFPGEPKPSPSVSLLLSQLPLTEHSFHRKLKLSLLFFLYANIPYMINLFYIIMLLKSVFFLPTTLYQSLAQSLPLYFPICFPFLFVLLPCFYYCCFLVFFSILHPSSLFQMSAKDIYSHPSPSWRMPIVRVYWSRHTLRLFYDPDSVPLRVH